MKLEKSIYFNLDEVSRINSMNKDSKQVKEKFTYQKPLTEDEIKERNDDNLQRWKRINELEAEVKELNAKKKKLKKETADAFQEILSKSVETTGKVWFIINEEKKTIETINEQGIIIDSERIKAENMNIWNTARDQKAS